MALSQIQLEAFYEVSKQGSFTRAARVLRLTQSALSHRIRNLEKDLETTLFIRQGTGVLPTSAGEKLLQFCRLQSQAEVEFVREIRTGGTSAHRLGGPLRIGGASTLMRSTVLPIIAEMIRSNPEIRLELMARELRELPRLIQNGQLDLLISCEKLSSPGLVEIHLGHEENVLIRSLRPDAIEDVYLDHDSEDQTTHRFFKHQGKSDDALRRAFLDDIYGILDGVAEGLGRAVVPVHLIEKDKKVAIVKGYKPLRVPI